MQNLSCRLCGAPLDDRNMDRRLAIISCRHCGGIYDLTKDQRSPSDDGRQPIEARAIAPLPSKFHIGHDRDKLTISWRWFGAKAIFLIVFTIVWFGILFYFATGPFGFSPFLLLHVAAGLFLAYQALANLFNTTSIVADGNRLTVRHAPVPWWPQPTIAVADIEQFYVVERIRRRKKNTTVSYAVHAVKRDNSNLKILGGLEDMGQALYLEQTLEKVMHIRDRPVAGEVRKERVHM